MIENGEGCSGSFQLSNEKPTGEAALFAARSSASTIRRSTLQQLSPVVVFILAFLAD